MKQIHLRKPSKFHAAIYSSTGVLFDDIVMAMTLSNELGSFDVIERHTNFISAVRGNAIMYTLTGEKKEVPINMGIVKISKLGVEVFVGFETLPGNKKV